MYQPETYWAALLFMILSMLCWGSWASSMKMAPKFPFQLFYWDYVVGALATSVFWGFTLGSRGGELSFLPNMHQADTAHIAWAVASGVLFNVANLLLVTAIDLAGLAVAFPVGIGLALVVGVLLNFLISPKGNPLLLFGGVILVVLAIVLNAVAYRRREMQRKTLQPARTRNQCGVRYFDGDLLSIYSKGNYWRPFSWALCCFFHLRFGHRSLRYPGELLFYATATDGQCAGGHEGLFRRRGAGPFLGNCRWNDLVHRNHAELYGFPRANHWSSSFLCNWPRGNDGIRHLGCICLA